MSLPIFKKFKRYIRLEDDSYILDSEWTHFSTIEDDEGNTLNETITEINNNLNSLNTEINDRLNGVTIAYSDGHFYATSGGVTKKLDFAE